MTLYNKSVFQEANNLPHNICAHSGFSVNLWFRCILQDWPRLHMDSYHCHFYPHLFRPNRSREFSKPDFLGAFSKRCSLKWEGCSEGDLLCLLLHRAQPLPSGERGHRPGHDLLCACHHAATHTHTHLLLLAWGEGREPELCEQVLLPSDHNVLRGPYWQTWLWISLSTSRRDEQPSADDWKHLRSRSSKPCTRKQAPPGRRNAWCGWGEQGQAASQTLLPLQRHLHGGQRHHPQHH